MKSLYDRFASSEDGAQLLAATRLRREVLRILHRALTASGLTQSQLAERLHVRKSAVSQVFRGDGNLRVNTLAQYLGAMGYELDVRVVEAGEPRNAILEGREMIPAIKQDWVEPESAELTSEVQHEATSQEAYFHLATTALKLHFVPDHLTTTLVEMRMNHAHSSGGSLWDFRGATEEVALPSISMDQEFHPIRSEATS
ncbi:helix-turn-helix domain-containing protein [Streptomyces sp. NPDC001507]|uniref:helix-turn-helix domain-containing protein n=1 Tax=Streptomyces sp. NPDC001507 TaxID=3364579 RepID=UPI0036813CD9